MPRPAGYPRNTRNSFVKESETTDLSGTWHVQLDPDDRGLRERWFEQFPEDGIVTVALPGSLQEQRVGDLPGPGTTWVGNQFDKAFYHEDRYKPYRQPESFKFPYWLQPDRRYIGPAWFTRTFELAPDKEGRRIVLLLERPHWETRVYLDGKYIGSNDSLSVPHEYDLGTEVKPGEHSLVIRVDNRLLYNVGPNAHSVSDHTQGNWNGIVGRVELRSESPVWIEDVQVVPSIRRRSATVRVEIGNRTGNVVLGEAEVSASYMIGSARGSANSEITENVAGPDNLRGSGNSMQAGFEIPRYGTTIYRELRFVEDVPLWDEFIPELVTVDVALSAKSIDAGRSYNDSHRLQTGLREVSAEDKELRINNRKLFLRGTLECCVFPLTGYPPTDVDSWSRICDRIKEYGLNHLRFHSWCPPAAAFEAADRAGVYLQVECPAWANQGASVGENAPFDDWLFREGERIVRAYGNHPSFIMMAYGNEPAGRIEEFLGLWVTHWKSRDSRRVYTSGAGWPAIPENDYHNIPEPRIQAWGAGLDSRINALPPATVTDYSPSVDAQDRVIVSHEIGQWCVFPNFDEIPKYSGTLKPKNFEIFRDFLEKKGMGDQARDFLHSSGRLQVLAYKEEIESALRTPGFGGFQLLGLNDFPGQGTALVGVLDPFWDDKGYVTGDEFREFCGPSVLLARLPRRCYRSSEVLDIAVDIAHYGESEHDGVRVQWRIESDAGHKVVSGEFSHDAVVVRGLTRIGRLSQALGELNVARRYQLILECPQFDIRNRWDFWVFPDMLHPDTSHAASERAETPDGRRARKPDRSERSASDLKPDVLVVRELDSSVYDRISAGATALFVPPAETVKSDVELGFSPVFWNTAWTNGQAPHTLGLVCDPGHPCLRHFPTQNHSNWQWWELIHGAAAIVLDELPHSVHPIIQPIDTWFRSHRLALLFEATVGAGKIVVSSMDVVTDLENRIVARQMRYSIDEYMSSGEFAPNVSLEREDLAKLF